MRPDRLAVVAVLGVVVVLEDERVAILGPGHERGPALGRHHRAGREVVGRSHDDSIRACPGQRRDVEAGLVDGDRNDLQAVVDRRETEVLEPGVLAGDPPAATILHGLDDEAERLGEAVADDDVLGVRARPANAVQVDRELVAELGGAADVEVAEPVARGLVHDAADGLHPGLARELGDVGPAVAEVDARLLDLAAWLAAARPAGPIRPSSRRASCRPAGS